MNRNHGRTAEDSGPDTLPEDLFRGRSPRHSILLVNPPDPPETSCNRDCNGGYGMAFPRQEQPNYPPMDFLYSATCLKTLEARVEVLDSCGRPVDLEQVNPGQFDLVAIRTSYPNFLNDLDFVKRIRQAAPRATVYLFGPYLATVSDRDRERAVPLCGLIVGEAEVPLIDLVCGRDPETLPGVVPAPRDGRTGPETGAVPFFLGNLDLLPYPDWSLIDLDGYTMQTTTGREEPIFSVLSSRGCYYRCHYCAYPLGHGKKLRFRSVGNVAGELDNLMTRFGASQVVFRDPLFTADRERVRELLAAIRELVKKHGRPLNWIAETRPDHLDQELLREMARSGCMEINLGLETASEEVSRKNGRPFTEPARIAEIVAQCRDLKINVFLFFLVGLPGDTEQGFLRTVHTIKCINPHFFKGFIVVPYPGTRVGDWARERGYFEEYEEQYQTMGRVCTMRTDDLDQQKIVELEMRAFRELCESKSRWLLENLSRASFPELQRDLLAHVANLEIQQRWDEVPAFITPLIEHPESSANELYLRRGNAWSRLGDEERALRDYREQARRTGDTVTLLLRQMVALAWLGRRGEAEEVLGKLDRMASSPEEADYFKTTALNSFAEYDQRSGSPPGPPEP